jgi:hypothetical protein
MKRLLVVTLLTASLGGMQKQKPIYLSPQNAELLCLEAAENVGNIQLYHDPHIFVTRNRDTGELSLIKENNVYNYLTYASHLQLRQFQQYGTYKVTLNAKGEKCVSFEFMFNPEVGMSAGRFTTDAQTQKPILLVHNADGSSRKIELGPREPIAARPKAPPRNNESPNISLVTATAAATGGVIGGAVAAASMNNKNEPISHNHAGAPGTGDMFLMGGLSILGFFIISLLTPR